MRQYFLKSIGSAESPLDNEWLTTGWGNLPNRSDLLDRIRFAKNKRPSGVNRHDLLVLYAAGWERIFGIAVVTSEEPYERPDPNEERWPWVLDVEVPIVVPRIDLAPALSEINVAPTSVRQQSHIHLSEAQYDLAINAFLTRVGR